MSFVDAGIEADFVTWPDHPPGQGSL